MEVANKGLIMCWDRSNRNGTNKRTRQPILKDHIGCCRVCRVKVGFFWGILVAGIFWCKSRVDNKNLKMLRERNIHQK